MTQANDSAGPRATVTIRDRGPTIVRNDQVYPVMRRPGVHRLLVTWNTEEQCQAFSLQAFCVANFIRARGNTGFYTVFDEGLESVMEAARLSHVTIQQMSDNPDAEEWLLISKGEPEPWQPAGKGAGA